MNLRVKRSETKSWDVFCDVVLNDCSKISGCDTVMDGGELLSVITPQGSPSVVGSAAQSCNI